MKTLGKTLINFFKIFTYFKDMKKEMKERRAWKLNNKMVDFKKYKYIIYIISKFPKSTSYRQNLSDWIKKSSESNICWTIIHFAQETIISR